MIDINEKAISRKEYITVEFFYKNTERLGKLHLFSKNANLNKKITDQNLHRPGLALTGFVDLFSYKRIQIFGNTENQYLLSLPEKEQVLAIENILKFDIPCIIFTDNNKPSDELIEIADKYQVPLFGTPCSTTKVVYLISDYLDDQFAKRITIHGSFVDVYGVGILFVGKSGIGKSEVALDLVERGHRFVADDVIILTKKGEGILMGVSTELAKHNMEIRGLGIIDIERMFGIRAIRYQKRLEIIVELEIWDKDAHYTRTGLDVDHFTISEVEIPYIKLPIIPGKNITVISEVISLNYLLKHYGHDAAKIFKNRLNQKLNETDTGSNRATDYFEHDFE